VSKSIAVFTALTRGYDDLLAPLHDAVGKEADFICFTDNPAREGSGLWRMAPTVRTFDDPVRTARYVKVNSHLHLPEYEYTVWLDANQRLVAPGLVDLIERHLPSADLALYRHSQRNSIREEAQTCIQAGLDDPEVVERQMARYRREGFPDDLGLAATCLILRRNSDRVRRFNEEWWAQIEGGSRRDQLSFDYVRWKTGLPVTWIPGRWDYSPINYRVGHLDPQGSRRRAAAGSRSATSLVRRAAAAFLPMGLRDRIRERRDPDRHERRRLEGMGGGVLGSTTLFGKPFEFVDAPSFLSARREIVDRLVYEFACAGDNPRIVDVGANVGVSVAWFKHRYPGARITAFEADPVIFRTLARNASFQEWTGVELINRAVWRERGSVLFHREDGDAGTLVTSATGGRRPVEVEAVTLGGVLRGECTDFLKLDVEGAEADILEECAGALGGVRSIFVEYHSFAGQPQRMGRLMNLLEDAGFRVFITTPLAITVRPYVFHTTYKEMDMVLNIHGIRAWS
jgi:FkbM family methyltransferase